MTLKAHYGPLSFQNVKDRNVVLLGFAPGFRKRFSPHELLLLLLLFPMSPVACACAQILPPCPPHVVEDLLLLGQLERMPPGVPAMTPPQQQQAH
jgi:hypothetical protein